MTRNASMLLAVVLTVLQPALAMCQCVGCSGGCAPQHASQSAGKSCCSAVALGSTDTCCGSTSANCACHAAGGHADHGATKSGTQSHGSACLCSSQPHATAISTDAVQIDLASGGNHAFLAIAPPSELLAVPTHATLATAEHGPPGRYGGLRVHAYFGVWLI